MSERQPRWFFIRVARREGVGLAWADPTLVTLTELTDSILCDSVEPATLREEVGLSVMVMTGNTSLTHTPPTLFLNEI